MIYDSRRSRQPIPEAVVDLYLHLATASGQQQQTLQEGKFLVLAACAAHDAGYADIADDCRSRIVQQNANHMLKSYRTMTEAVSAGPILEYADQLRKIYPLEKAEYLLLKLRASGYKGEHAFAARLGIDNPKAVLKSPRNGSTTASRVARQASAKAPRAASAKSEPAIEPLPLEWPEDRAFPPVNRTVIVAFVIGTIAGLAVGAWFGSDLLSRILTFLG